MMFMVTQIVRKHVESHGIQLFADLAMLLHIIFVILVTMNSWSQYVIQEVESMFSTNGYIKGF